MTTFAFSSLSMFILWAGCFINENDDLCLLLFIHIYSVSMLQYQQWKLRPLSFPLYPYLLCEHAVVPTMKMTTFAFFSLSIFTLSASCCTNNENDILCLFLVIHTYSILWAGCFIDRNDNICLFLFIHTYSTRLLILSLLF